MLRINRVIIFGTIVSLFLITIKPMTHKWPHYKKDSGEETCTCLHMEAVIEYFKDKSDLTMVLGAGDEEHDYSDTEIKGIKYRARFPNYNIVVSNSLTEPQKKRLFKSTQELENKMQPKQSEPIQIPLNFEQESFFYFLSKLPNKFKEIIFDDSVIKFVYKWGLWNVNTIFDALKDGGEFYFENGFGRIDSAYAEVNGSDGYFAYSNVKDPQNFISISNNQVKYQPEYGNIAEYNLYVGYLMLRLMRNPKFDDTYAFGKTKSTTEKIRAGRIIRDLKNNALSKDLVERVKDYILNFSTFYMRPKMFVLHLKYGKDFTAGKYVTKIKDSNPSDGTFIVPNDEFVAEHVVAFLKLVGFEAEYRQNAPYPSPPNGKPWIAYPGNAENRFAHYNYIYAKKPVDINKRLTSIKEHVALLKYKLVTIQTKLNELRVALAK